jgi:hypothetical protein
VLAIAGVLGVICLGGVASWNAYRPEPNRPQATVAQPLAVNAIAQPAVFSNGETIIRGTWFFDLDNGVTAISRTDSDLFWEQETDTKRTLNPMNGALFALVGQRDFDSLQLQTLKGLNDVSNAIPTGTVLAYRTKHGRYGKLLIEYYAYDLKVKWITFGP